MMVFDLVDLLALFGVYAGIILEKRKNYLEGNVTRRITVHLNPTAPNTV